MPSYSELIKMLPYKLRIRFDSLSAYVKGIIDDEEQSLEPTLRLKPDDVHQVQLLVFISVLDNFFQEGTTAAKSAVASFRRLGVDGFSVGNSVFEGQNENVLMGETLSNRLHSALSSEGASPSLRQVVLRRRRGIRDLVRALMRQVRNAKIVD
jgi:hypothetical protein